MNRRNVLMIGILVVVLSTAAMLGLGNWVLGATEEASAPIQALPVQLEPTQTAAEVQDETQGEGTAPAAEIFTISQAESVAQFTIYEELLGQPKDVVGTTDQVAGEILVDLGDLSTAQVGVIQVNARTLVTDADRRNQAIRNFILNTDSYEFIIFTPTEIIGLEGSAAPGETLEFQIAGDLTIRDITNPVMFTVTAQVVSEDQLAGSALATIQRGDYDLTIPSVPNVANVGEEVTLEIGFVANATTTTSNLTTTQALLNR